MIFEPMRWEHAEQVELEFRAEKVPFLHTEYSVNSHSSPSAQTQISKVNIGGASGLGQALTRHFAYPKNFLCSDKCWFMDSSISSISCNTAS